MLTESQIFVVVVYLLQRNHNRIYRMWLYIVVVMYYHVILLLVEAGALLFWQTEWLHYHVWCQYQQRCAPPQPTCTLSMAQTMHLCIFWA